VPRAAPGTGHRRASPRMVRQPIVQVSRGGPDARGRHAALGAPRSRRPPMAVIYRFILAIQLT
jgi:hypothetical protein